MSADKIGGLLEKLGRLDEAIPYYQLDLKIAERLAAKDPSNAGWQRDVEISRRRMERLKREAGCRRCAWCPRGVRP